MLHKKQVISHYHIVIPVILLSFLTLGVFITVFQTQETQNISSNAATTNCTVSSSKLTVKSQEQILFGEINQYRVQHSVDHLIWNNTLKQSSAWQSADMLTHNNLSHTDSLGRTPDIRLKNCGYDINNGYGENIANGSTDPNSVFNAWKNDPPHNTILLNPRYNIAAIDMETSNGKTFWTMDLGTSSPITTPVPTVPQNAPTLILKITPTITIAPTKIIVPTVTKVPATPVVTSAISVSPSPSDTPSTSDEPVTSPSPDPTPAPVGADMQISVQVQIHGIGQGGNNSPKHLTRKVTAIVFGAQQANQAVTTGTGFLSYDGSNYFSGLIHLGKLSEGAYFIKLVSDNTLQVLAKPEFQTLKIGKVTAVPPVTLYQGDMNGDNVLDINDYNLILPCFQSLTTCPSVNVIDFNDDGKTDAADYNLLLQSYEVLHGN
jgi:uncharacterized protein YkwD